MISTSKARAILTGAAIALAALLAACSEPKPAAPKLAAPAVTLSPRLIEQAGAYRAYVQRAGAISPAFADGDAIAQSLRTAAAYEPKQLLRGAMAYGAVAALQDRRFVAAVRTYAADPQTRQTMTLQIMRNPNYVTSLDGADGAAGLVAAALGDEGQRLYAAGKAVKQAAYDVQKNKWSKADVANRVGRLAEAKMLSATPLVGDTAEIGRLSQAALGAAPLGLTGRTVSAPYPPVVVRSMAVAALAVLGEAGDANVEQVTGLMADPMSASCLHMSKLNLYQCLAVSKPHYEDVFCLGQHILMDTGQCLMRSAGLPAPVETRPVKVAQTAPAAAPAAPARKGSGKKR